MATIKTTSANLLAEFLLDDLKFNLTYDLSIPTAYHSDLLTFNGDLFDSLSPTKAVAEIKELQIKTTVTGLNLNDLSLASITGIENINEGAKYTMKYATDKPLTPGLLSSSTVNYYKYESKYEGGSEKADFSGEIVFNESTLASTLIKKYNVKNSTKDADYSDSMTLNMESTAGVMINGSTGSGIFNKFKYTYKDPDFNESYDGVNVDMGNFIAKILNNTAITTAEIRTILLQGDDKIKGTANGDSLTGGKGYDSLTGGNGDDWFYFSSGDAPIDPLYKKFDTITDYKIADDDTVALNFTVNSITDNGINPFKSIQLAEADANQQMQNDLSLSGIFQVVGKNGYLYLDFDGNHISDSVIKFTGVQSLNDSFMGLEILGGYPTLTENF